MKKILIIAGALVVLGGGGAGAYFFFMQPAEAAPTAETAQDASAHTDGEHAKGDDAHGDGHEAQTEYVELQPLLVPVIDEEGVSQVLSLVVAIEVDGKTARSEVEKAIPRLQDAYIHEMYGVISKQNAMKGGVLQIGFLKEKSNKISARVLGKEEFSGVLLQLVQQRSL